MKIHRLLAEAVISNISQIFIEDKYADKVIERSLKQNRKWGSRDRGFVAEHTYEFVRWWRLLQYMAETGERTDKGALWRMFGALLLIKGEEIPPWSEFRDLNSTEFQKRFIESAKDNGVRESIPDWLNSLGKKELEDKWDHELHALNEQAPLVIRVNTLKTDPGALSRKLTGLGIETSPVKGLEDALLVKKRTNLFSLAEFREGMFELQDASSQKVATFLAPEPGMRVIDACAGAGGKTLHLAALMQNKGRIIAMDTGQWKLDELTRRAKRAGAFNIEPRVIESGKTIKRLESGADRLLLDVPCSGLGVLKRNPDTKWKIRPEQMEVIRKTQQNILNNYSSILKPGGRMVYATCSILPSENEEQVSFFLNQHPSFKLIDEQHTWPSEGFDGFYMALMRRD